MLLSLAHTTLWVKEFREKAQRWADQCEIHQKSHFGCVHPIVWQHGWRGGQQRCGPAPLPSRLQDRHHSSAQEVPWMHTHIISRFSPTHTMLWPSLLLFSKLVGIWGALSLMAEFEGKPCHIQVEQASPFLSSLAASSRTFSFSWWMFIIIKMCGDGVVGSVMICLLFVIYYIYWKMDSLWSLVDL